MKGETNKNLENVLILRDVKTIQHKANYYLDFTVLQIMYKRMYIVNREALNKHQKMNKQIISL